MHGDWPLTLKGHLWSSYIGSLVSELQVGQVRCHSEPLGSWFKGQLQCIGREQWTTDLKSPVQPSHPDHLVSSNLSSLSLWSCALVRLLGKASVSRFCRCSKGLPISYEMRHILVWQPKSVISLVHSQHCYYPRVICCYGSLTLDIQECCASSKTVPSSFWLSWSPWESSFPPQPYKQ